MVGTIVFETTGTMSGIICSPSGELFVSKGPVVWQLDRSTMTPVRYAGQLFGSAGREGHRLRDASFRRARGMSFTDRGFFVVDTDDSRVLEIKDDYVSFFAGTEESGFLDGPRLLSQFRHPCSIVMLNDTWIISDTGNQRIRFIDADGLVTSIGGGTGIVNGAFESATFTNPCMLCVTPRETVLCTDGAMQLLRELDLEKRNVTTMEAALENVSQALSATHISTPTSVTPLESKAKKHHSKLTPRAVAERKTHDQSLFQVRPPTSALPSPSSPFSGLKSRTALMYVHFLF